MNGPRVGLPIMFASGRKFWPLDPRPEDVHLDDIVNTLAQLCRWGGSTSRFYSVAQHSTWVARRVARTHPHLTMQALLHDAAEAYVGDQRRPFKAMLRLRVPNGFESFEAIERRVHAVILRALGVRPSTSSEWRVIAAADEEALATEARDLLNGQVIGTAAPVPGRLPSWAPHRARDEFRSVFEAHALPEQKRRESSPSFWNVEPHQRPAELPPPTPPSPPPQQQQQHPATQPLAPGQYRGRRGTILDDRSSD